MPAFTMHRTSLNTNRRLLVARNLQAIAVLALCTLANDTAVASDQNLPTESSGADLTEIVVYGRAQSQIDDATSASQGFVNQDDIRLPPRLRVGDLVEVVPGMVATQHSGIGKANQYFLRGFNLDHGTDFSATVDGIPINMPSHGHGQGYLDLNFLIPETVGSTHYRRGPYAAEVGDFSSAASVSFDLIDQFEKAFVSTSLGAFGEQRLVGAGSISAAAGEFTAAAEVARYDGPWVLPEDANQLKGYAAYTQRIKSADVRLTWQGYDSDWRATDQIPDRAISSGEVSRFGSLDDDLGGRTTRHALAMNADFESWRVNAYAIDYDFRLFSNFTYFLNDSRGDEFEQVDNRRVYGVGIRNHEHQQVSRWDIRWGADIRVDDISQIGLYNTVDRERIGTVRQDAVRLNSISGWTQINARINEALRAVLGARLDRHDWNVDARLPQNSGSGNDVQFSPKASLIWSPGDHLAVYFNYGRGFHSNDVRGATITTDPQSLESADAVAVIVPSDGTELGLRYESGSGLNATLTIFVLDLESELVYVGDAGTTEAGNATRRTGIETEMFWQATDWLALNAAYAYTDARQRNTDPGFDHIPGAVSSTLTFGLNAVWREGWSASARLRWLDSAPLTDDGAISSRDSLLLNMGVARQFGSAEIRFDVLNALNTKDADVAYFFESRLANEPESVADIHAHPLAPRALRGTITWRW
ncbi:MAG: TonB-dependent receptor [Pseudomonadota bacterium]